MMGCSFARCSQAPTALIVDLSAFSLLFRHGAGVVCEGCAAECERNGGVRVNLSARERKRLGLG